MEAALADLGLRLGRLPGGRVALRRLRHHPARAAPATGPTASVRPGVLTVALIHRPEGLDYREWINRWHGTQSPGVGRAAAPDPLRAQRGGACRCPTGRPRSTASSRRAGRRPATWPTRMLFFNATTPEELERQRDPDDGQRRGLSRPDPAAQLDHERVPDHGRWAEARPGAVPAPGYGDHLRSSACRTVRPRPAATSEEAPVGLSIGIVGLPNVGKSTLFNALTRNEVLAANYPFATIDPNVGVVAVPDARLDRLAELFESEGDRAGHGHLRGHRRHRQGCLGGGGPGQQVPGRHPRERRHLPGGPGLHRPRRDPRGRADLTRATTSRPSTPS